MSSSTATDSLERKKPETRRPTSLHEAFPLFKRIQRYRQDHCGGHGAQDLPYPFSSYTRHSALGDASQYCEAYLLMKSCKNRSPTKHMVAESVNGMSFDQQLRASLSQRYCRQPTCIISPWMPHSLHWQNLQRTGTLFNNSKWKDLKPASPSR